MQKKKKKQEVLELWTNLKQKLLTTITELQEIKTHGFKAVYGSNAALQKLHITQETTASKAEQLANQLASDSQHYQEQLTVRLIEFTRLEKKLEQVRNLLADNQITKLQTLFKKGEI